MSESVPMDHPKGFLVDVPGVTNKRELGLGTLSNDCMFIEGWVEDCKTLPI
jgi:hypothetical protein